MHRTTATTKPHTRVSIAPRRGVCVAIAIGLVALTFLIPNRDELFRRFVTDGDSQAASHLLKAGSGENPAALTKALVIELLDLCERDSWNRSSVETLTTFLHQEKDFRTATHTIVAKLDSLPRDSRGVLVAILIERALAEGDLDFAVATQDQLISSTTDLTPDFVRLAVKTYRYAGQPGRAFDLINQLDDQSVSLPSDLRELRITLARETSNSQMAFNLVAIKVRGTRDPAELRRLIPQAIKIGTEAGQLQQLIPLYERYLAVCRESNDPLLDDYTLRLAKTFEWAGSPAKAFDTYLTIASKGNREALDRCIALNVGLFRSSDLLEALLAADEVVSRDDKLLKLSAELLADAARRDEAIARFETYLERCPTDAAAFYRLAMVHDERLDARAGLPALTAAHNLDPTNVTYLAKLSAKHIALGGYEEAMSCFKKLIAISDDHEFGERFYTLAYSLDDAPAMQEALEHLLTVRPESAHALALSNLHRSRCDFSSSIAVLSEALETASEPLPLRLELAQLQLIIKRPDQALDTLRPVNLSRCPDAIPLVVDSLSSLPISGQARALPELLRFFGPALAGSPHLPANRLVDIANLELQHGSATRGRELMRRAVDECSEPRLLAQAYFGLDQPRAALGHQLSHIKQTSRPSSEDYNFLGDLYTALGDKHNASSAYNYALVLLKGRLQTRTNQ